jgi:hypothetical protein
MKKSQFVRVDTVRETRKTNAHAIFGCIQKFCGEGGSERKKPAIVLGEESVDVDKIL